MCILGKLGGVYFQKNCVVLVRFFLRKKTVLLVEVKAKATWGPTVTIQTSTLTKLK